MMTQTFPAPIPAAWLRPLPEGYKIPLWRWIILPAGALMLRRNGGVWVNGALALTGDGLQFTQTRMIKRAGAQPPGWTLPLARISNIEVVKGLASETLLVHHSGTAARLMTVRAEDFIASLRNAIGQP